MPTTIRGEADGGNPSPENPRPDRADDSTLVDGSPPYHVTVNGLTPDRRFHANDGHRHPRLQSALRKFDRLAHSIQVDSHRKVRESLESLRRAGFEVKFVEPSSYWGGRA